MHHFIITLLHIGVWLFGLIFLFAVIGFFAVIAWIIKAVRRTETTVQGGVRNVEGRLSGTTRRSTTSVEDDVP